MLAERVEVLRGPASVLYGSNAMGGVVNIVTRRQEEEGVNTGFQLGGGSYGTLQTEVSNRVKKGRFNSVEHALPRSRQLTPECWCSEAVRRPR